MDDEKTFRIMLVLWFAVLVGVGGYYRIRSHTGEKLDRRQEGIPILISLRLLGLICFCGLVAYMINSGSMAWAAMSLPIWLRWLGVVAGVLSLILATWTFRTLGSNITDTVVTREKHSLVTTGPYRWVRHPFYVSFAMVVVGIAFVTTNWFLALFGALAFLVTAIRTGIKEENLVKRFGESYREYMEKTGRFLPRWR